MQRTRIPCAFLSTLLAAILVIPGLADEIKWTGSFEMDERPTLGGWFGEGTHSVQLADGTVVTVYYFVEPDGMQFVGCTRWQVP